MSKRREPLVNGEIYHIYNRGNNKRVIFEDTLDSWRFLMGLKEFNTTEPVHFFKQFKNNSNNAIRNKIEVEVNGNCLVEIIAYCLNPNHFHLILKQVHNDGISIFMKKLLTGYVMYFNERHKYSGSLFQGVFKSRIVDSQVDLDNLSMYVNLNFLIHNLDINKNKIIRSSIIEYINNFKSTLRGLSSQSSRSMNICKGKNMIDIDSNYYNRAKNRVMEIKEQRNEFRKEDWE